MKGECELLGTCNFTCSRSLALTVVGPTLKEGAHLGPFGSIDISENEYPRIFFGRPIHVFDSGRQMIEIAFSTLLARTLWDMASYCWPFEWYFGSFNHFAQQMVFLLDIHAVEHRVNQKLGEIYMHAYNAELSVY